MQVKGDLAAAEPLQREALEVQRETLGNRHPSTLASMSNLGVLLCAKNDLVAAEPLIYEALVVNRETLGSHHPHTLSSLRGLRLLLKAKGKLRAAALLALGGTSLGVSRKILGSQHPSTLRLSMKRLGRRGRAQP